MTVKGKIYAMCKFFYRLLSGGRFAQRQFRGALCASPEADIAPAERNVARSRFRAAGRRGQRFRRWSTASLLAGHYVFLSEKTCASRKIYICITLAAALLAGCGKDDGLRQGYLEADMLYIGPVIGGGITKLAAERGQRVKKGDILFEIDAGDRQADFERAQASLARAEDDLKDILKGARPEELEALKAKLAQTNASLALAKIELDRTSKLSAAEAVAQKDFDNARLTHQRLLSELDEAGVNIKVAKLAGRDDKIASARDAVAEAQKSLDAAKWRFDKRTVTAPEDGLVYDAAMRAGEYAAAGAPVILLLPPKNVKIRYFVPFAEASVTKPGGKIEYWTNYPDGKKEAVITYVSPKPEYTSPLIYSRDLNEKLVFMIEASAAPSDAPSLNPGLPVMVRNLETLKK
jgi:HlyD family secretion protein